MKTITASQLKEFAAKLELDDTIDLSSGTIYATVSRQELRPTEETPVCEMDDDTLYETVYAEAVTVEEAIARFPKHFGLRAYTDKVFRIGVRESFMSDGVVKLYTQALFHTSELPAREQRGHDPNGYTWLDFAKGTEWELRQQLAPVPERWAEIVDRLEASHV